MNPISARLLNHQLVCPQFTNPRDVVAWMGAMQAQEYKMMRWAATMRTKKPSATAFEKAYNSGQILRVHLFRTTWQLIAAENWGWMLDLCRDNALRGMAGWMHSNGISIPENEQESIQTIFSDFLANTPSAQKCDLNDALLDKGIKMDDHRLSYHIRLAEYSGLICSGDLHPNKPTYALAANKQSIHSIQYNREESLYKLARIYFQSHGPATLEDFIWWSGLNTSQCKLALAAIQSELIEETWQGLTFYRHQNSRTRGFRHGTVTLLPSYDEYLIGYKSRHLVLQPDMAHRAHSGNGIFWPVILMDGAVVGNWSAPGGRVVCDIFHPEADINQASLQEQIDLFHYLKRNITGKA